MNKQGNENSPGPRALEDLNPLQREAVLAEGGPVLVEAAVGSGKTRVITHRLAWLLETGRAAADRLLVLTFTNRAAREMEQRVRGLLGSGTVSSIPYFGTFHSVCRRLLNEELPLDRYGFRRGFSICDEAERQALIGELAAEVWEGPGRPRVAVLVRSVVRLKQAACGSFSFADQGKGLPEVSDNPLDLEVHRLYQERMVAANALDFDDLILLPLRMLIDHTDVRKRLGERFDQILVDEFQDTDRLQYLILKGLLGPAKALFVVGDPNQSIYTWRGACPEIFRRFKEEYPAARVCRLAQHYRSSATILQTASKLASPADQGPAAPEPPWTENGPGPPVRLTACDDERDQADLVAREAGRLHREEGIGYGSMAVLYRVNAQAARVEAALRREGLPVRVVAPIKVTDLPPVRKLLALFKVLLTTDDRMSLRLAAALPAWKLTPLMLGRLEQAGERHALTLGQVLLSLDDLDDLPGQTRERAAIFASALEDLGAEAMVRSPAELFDMAVERSAFREKEIRVHTAAGEELWQRILEIRTLAEIQDDLDPWNAWPAFLADISLGRGVAAGQGASNQAINLMTIHAAKGLEFDAVFIIGLNEGLLPLAGRPEDSEEIEEERRLLFVGMTRARKHLQMTHLLSVTRRGAAPWPSRFLDLLPRSLLEISGPLPEPVSGGAFLDGDGRSGEAPERPSSAADQPESSGVGNWVPAVGHRVVHPRLGAGVVTELVDGRIRIRFDSAGEKELQAAFCPELRRITE